MRRHKFVTWCLNAMNSNLAFSFLVCHLKGSDLALCACFFFTFIRDEYKINL